jgi:hypothetical protein
MEWRSDEGAGEKCAVMCHQGQTDKNKTNETRQDKDQDKN